MKLHELQPQPGSVKAPKRLGRGVGSGLGKTSGKGHKGQNARSGGGVRPGFEGGQHPLIRRIPKRGFNNRFKKVYTQINVSALDGFDNGTTVTPELLVAAGIAVSYTHLDVYKRQIRSQPLGQYRAAGL